MSEIIVERKDFRRGDVFLEELPQGPGEWRRFLVERADPPRPALPTEPYVVIMVTLSIDPNIVGQVLTHDGNGWWSNSGHTLGRESTAKRIGAFAVLSEPRATTAKAVLKRIESEPWAREVDLTKWAVEFGVES